MFKNILAPTDGSQLSLETISRAIAFAKAISANLTFFYARPEYPIAIYGEGALIDPTTPESFAELTKKQGEEILATCSKMAAAEQVSSKGLAVTSDAPYQAIIDAAEAEKCDLIFMASHGRRGFAAMLLGSETNKVLTHSKIPVLVYR